VHVLAELVLPENFEDRRGELLPGERVLHPHEPERVIEAVDVLLEPEDIELSLLRVPVSPESLEDRGAELHRG